MGRTCVGPSGPAHALIEAGDSVWGAQKMQTGLSGEMEMEAMPGTGQESNERRTSRALGAQEGVWPWLQPWSLGVRRGGPR